MSGSAIAPSWAWLAGKQRMGRGEKEGEASRKIKEAFTLRPQSTNADGMVPSAFNREAKMPEHLILLLPIVVILVIKVKVIIKRK